MAIWTPSLYTECINNETDNGIYDVVIKLMTSKLFESSSYDNARQEFYTSLADMGIDTTNPTSLF